MGALIDISQVLHPALPGWPGEPGFGLRRHATIEPGCPVNTAEITLSTHAGTHADAPLHYDAAGLDSAASALDPYIGACVVLDVRQCGAEVTPDDVDWAAIDARRVLFRTYERFPHDTWDASSKAIAAEVIERLAGLGAVLIGTDSASLDPQDSKSMDAHHAVRRHDMRILEGLVLEHVAPGRYELIALPLRIAGADASPVRAVLRALP
ncbi:MAG: arylformamidase [Novosphingobium sp.]|nr:arylformamidase [Novosphingobium sp.]